jgi:hypothetical protein
VEVAEVAEEKEDVVLVLEVEVAEVAEEKEDVVLVLEVEVILDHSSQVHQVSFLQAYPY